MAYARPAKLEENIRDMRYRNAVLHLSTLSPQHEKPQSLRMVAKVNTQNRKNINYLKIVTFYSNLAKYAKCRLNRGIQVEYLMLSNDFRESSHKVVLTRP